ncbi:MAG: hypothetical protein KatS3mg111_2094 [Pirellulaceae bacterium]|nr:MAG: hypothetical protein KatS3mg111_2094 [Pirellulaceae bacterium]
MLLGEMGWDYQSLRDASFQRSANWSALFDPSTGQFDESFTVSGDDEVHLTGYEYHPTNTNLWKTPLEEALEELFPLDYLDTTGDPPSSTDPFAGDQSGDSSNGGDLDGYAGDYQGDVFGEEQGGSSGGVYYTAYSGSGQSETYSSSSPSRSGWSGFWDKVQLGLDVVGCIPVIGEAADGVNGVISLARGDHVGAGLSFASMIPVYGDAIGKGGKLARYAAKYGDEAAEAGKRVVDNAPRGIGAVDEAAELAAQQSLTALQGSIRNGHFLTRHSPMVTLDDLYRRATQGILPDGTKSFKTNATRFLRYTDMQEAIDKAIRSYRASGQTGPGSVVIDMLRDVGEGYYKGSGIYGRTRVVVVRFNELGQPYTAFPRLPKLP